MRMFLVYGLALAGAILLAISFFDIHATRSIIPAIIFLMVAIIVLEWPVNRRRSKFVSDARKVRR